MNHPHHRTTPIVCSLGVVLLLGVASVEAQTRKAKAPSAASPATAAKPAASGVVETAAPAQASTQAPAQVAAPVRTPAPSVAPKARVIRIGVATPKVQIGEAGGGDAAAAVRGAFSELMKSKTIEIVELESRLPIQISEEAKDKEIDFVLFTSLTQKKGGGMMGGGMFGRMTDRVVGRAAANVPYGGGIGNEIAREAANTAAQTASEMSRTVKAKDEITLEYSLVPAGGSSPLIANTAKAKAKSNGEDIITPLMESAANEMLTAVLTKK